MLDLNLADDPGSSNSSVISLSPSNTNDEDLSSAPQSVPEFIVNIAKKEGGKNLVGSTATSIITRELFPLATIHQEIGYSPLSRAVNIQAASSSRGESRWVNFSFNQGTSMKQKPKKSRRGPRSRSSQYRGVTFYRRTGRWESHIWSVIQTFFISLRFVGF